MTSLLESFLLKLPDNLLNSDLELSGLRVDATHKQILKRLPLLKESSAIGLAILIQHLDLQTFTDEELIEVSQLKFQYLDSILFPELKKYNLFSAEEPLYDTGSSRVYQLINVEEVSALTLQVQSAHFNNYQSSSLRELIVNLYNLGL